VLLNTLPSLRPGFVSRSQGLAGLCDTLLTGRIETIFAVRPCRPQRSREAARSQGALQTRAAGSPGPDQGNASVAQRRLGARPGMVALARGNRRTDKLLSLILGDAVLPRSDDSAFSVEHGPAGTRRDTSGNHQHHREASIAAAAAAAAAAVQQQQQKQRQLLTQEQRLGELMRSGGDQSASGRIPPGAPTSITADARSMQAPPDRPGGGRAPRQPQQHPQSQTQNQPRPQPQQQSAAAHPSAPEQPLKNHPHYRVLKEINR